MQKLTRPALYEGLKAYHFDMPGIEVPFTLRLANAKGWSPAFAERAVREYLRFVYLATISTSELTPSVPVDEVWHFHLEDQQNYLRMCTDILGKPLQHRAGDGKADEPTRFNRQYRRTLTQYQMEFGAPPGDVWPQKKAAFGRRKEQRVADQTASLRPVGWGRRVLAKLFLGLAALGGGGFVYGLVFGVGGLVLTGFAALVLGILARAMLLPAQAGPGGSSCGGGGCGSSTSDDNSSAGDSGSDGGSSCGGGGCGGGGD